MKLNLRLSDEQKEALVLNGLRMVTYIPACIWIYKKSEEIREDKADSLFVRRSAKIGELQTQIEKTKELINK